jgi:putative methyltransferase (TIGR04325 family)
VQLFRPGALGPHGSMTGDSHDDRGQAEHVWFRGNYSSWDEARAASTGYDAPDILERVRAATLKVLSGAAACERDSVAFERVEYSLPVLVCLLYVATRADNQLDLLDFGGSLGSSYWQNRHFLGHLRVRRWSIVEQPHFVKVGQAEIADDVLRFYHSIDECLAEGTPNAVLLSGVLQALRDPFALFGSVLSKRVPFVIVDRTQFFVDDLPDRITVEHVDPAIYDGSYPSWFLNLRGFRHFIAAEGYRIVEEFDSWEHWDVDGHPAQNKCFLLELGDKTS